jgi:metallo-beta-lactamase family protein
MTRAPRRSGSRRPILRFLGAAGTVTGSRFLVETERARVLVDCGLFQGLKELRLRNWTRPPIEPEALDAVLLTHAHLDHTGYLPALCRDGFRGPVLATPATCELSGILLPDSGHVQEDDAAYANRKGFSKHHPALPLYTEEDARRALVHFEAVGMGTRVNVAQGMHATFLPAGHILGSAIIVLELDHPSRRTIVFSGDLGRPSHPLLRPPAVPPRADVLLVESTYGDRVHQDAELLLRFESAISRTAERGGTVIIPSFAVDRTEVILYHLRRLVRARRVPELPVYVDSPLALDGLRIYRRALETNSPEVLPGIAGDGDPFDTGRLIETRRTEDSKAIHDVTAPAIIIAASGMATGGRVLHHLARRLPDERNTVVLAGFQAAGTRGKALCDGARTLKMHGREIPVRAEVVSIPAFSVHADRTELLAWLAAAPARSTYVVHGEPAAAASLRDAIEAQLRGKATVARHLETVPLD